MGEALVGNEAVDQLVKFNRALIDYADTGEQDPRAIDGIVLTKFDTIDDKARLFVAFTAENFIDLRILCAHTCTFTLYILKYILYFSCPLSLSLCSFRWELPLA